MILPHLWHRRALISVCAATLSGSHFVRADVALPPVFSSGMVLQTGVPVPVWGKAAPGEKISILFAGQTKEAKANEDGCWNTVLDPLPVSAAPQRLQIGGHTLDDVLVGEVWLCSGQSNMQWLVGKHGDYPGVEGGDEEIAGRGVPEVRLFSDPKDPSWQGRGWKHATGEDLRVFSATAWFFGKALQRELKVPVGLINVSRGGSSIQSWIPADFNARNPITRRYSGMFREHLAELNAFNKATHEANLARRAGRADAQYPSPLAPEIAIANRFSGSSLFDELIDPLAPFAVKGVAWYQGESNADFPETARVYDSMLRDLIEGWRCRWSADRIPWHVVQLPTWDSPAAAQWPWIRQGQMVVSRSMPEVHLVTTSDIGDGSDLHPPQKREVGERLAASVLESHYRKKIAATGPVVRSVLRDRNGLSMEFDSGGTGKGIKSGGWSDVEVAGEDGVFHPAKAVLRKDSAMVSADAIPFPVAVRYGWAGFFRPSLFNGDGLPASPFFLNVLPQGGFRFVSSDDTRSSPLDGDRWCAIGDSITHAGGYLKTIQLYQATRFPRERFELFNCGAGGDTASGTLTRRMEGDILTHRPTLATVMLGINDVWWEHGGLIGPNDYIRDISRMVDRLHAAGSGVMLVTPSPYDATAKGSGLLDPKRAGLERYVGQLRLLAAERAIPVIDVFQVMSDITKREQASDPDFSLMGPDRIHPEAKGNFVIAHAVLKAMRAPATVSRVSIDSRRLEPWRVENAELGELSRNGGGISFRLLEHSLPFPAVAIPEETRQLMDFTGDFNQEVFQVTGLPEGRYELAIDGSAACTFSAADWEKGVNVALIAGTPQNRQAAEVNELIEQRTAIVSGKLRYIAMIEYGELKKSYPVGDAASPERDLKGSGKSYPEYFALKPRQAEIIEEVRKLEERIQEIGRPVSHRWELRRR